MTRRDYHPTTERQNRVLDALRAGPADGYGTNPLALEAGLTFKQTLITAEALVKRGLVIRFTYRGGAQVWRVAPEP